MTQLHKGGFVHHLGRHSLACFLTRGDLWVSWEQGFKVFEKYLIDYDYALNSANWMWLSCSPLFVMYHRVYSPVAFGKKWDKHGKFIRHYLPVLQKMPSEYIYEPWKAPRDVQKKVRCIVGKDYPNPIVDHLVVSKINVETFNERMKNSYSKSEFGTSSEQTDGEVSTTLNAATTTSKSQSDEDVPRRREEDVKSNFALTIYQTNLRYQINLRESLTRSIRSNLERSRDVPVNSGVLAPESSQQHQR